MKVEWPALKQSQALADPIMVGGNGARPPDVMTTQRTTFELQVCYRWIEANEVAQVSISLQGPALQRHPRRRLWKGVASYQVSELTAIPRQSRSRESVWYKGASGLEADVATTSELHQRISKLIAEQ